MSLLRIVLVLSVAFGVAFTGECPTYWLTYGGCCYRPFGPAKTWHNAKGHCAGFTSTSGQTANLVSVHSSSEDNFLKSLLETTYGLDGGRYWIGLNELRLTGEYKWSDNSNYDFQGWMSGEPNDHEGTPERCVEMFGPSSGWNDAPCGISKSYICKMPK